MADDEKEAIKKKRVRPLRRVGDKTAEGRRIEEEDLDPIELSAMYMKPVITAAKLIKPRKKDKPRGLPRPNILLKGSVLWGKVEPEKPKVQAVATVVTEVMDRPKPPPRRPPSIGSMQPNLGKG